MPASVVGEPVLMRAHELQLRMGQLHKYIGSLLPAVQASLESLAADLARVGDGALPVELRRAVQRKRMYLRRGGRKGEAAGRARGRAGGGGSRPHHLLWVGRRKRFPPYITYMCH